MSDILKIKEAIEAERVAQNLSQRELCKRAGVSSATYNVWMKRRDTGNIATTFAFCKALGFELELRKA